MSFPPHSPRTGGELAPRPDPDDWDTEYVSTALGRFPRAPHVLLAPTARAPLLLALLSSSLTPTAPQKGENKTPMTGLNPTHLHGRVYWLAVLAVEMGRHALPGADWSARGLHVPHPQEGSDPAEACHALEYSCTSGLVVDVLVPSPVIGEEGFFSSKAIALSEVASWAGGEINGLECALGELLADLRRQRPDIALIAAQNYAKRKP